MWRRSAWLVGFALPALLLAPGAAPSPVQPVVAVATVQAPRAVDIADHLASADQPARPRIVYGARVSRPLIALTFDLDMSPWMAAQLRTGQVRSWVNQDALDLLQATGTRATLFMTGMWAEAYPELARRLASNPRFEIGNHTYVHAAYHVPCYRLAGLSRAGMAADISASQQTIERITGVRPTYFRFPGGCYDRAALDAVHAAGLIPVQWTVNAGDAFNPYAQQIASTVIHGVKPGAIVIMHLHGGPNAPASGAALRIILPALRAQGYEFLTVGELLAQAQAVEPAAPPEVVEVYQPELPPVLRGGPVRWCRWLTPQKRLVLVRC